MEYQKLREGEINDIILLHTRGLDFWCMLKAGNTAKKALHFAASRLVTSLHFCVSDLAANVLSKCECFHTESQSKHMEGYQINSYEGSKSTGWGWLW